MKARPHRSSGTRTARSAHTDQGTAVRRWLHGQALAAVRIRQAAAEEGPDPRQAVAEALSAVNALAEMGLWPGPRDPASEAAVIQVRERWAGIQKRAMRVRAR
jgi:hypothetical protein